MSKEELGTIFFIGVILRWYKEHSTCWRHGCMMDLHFSQWLPKGEALLLCPECQVETLMPRLPIMTIEPEPEKNWFTLWGRMR